MAIGFSTKAQTLMALQGQLKSAKIAPSHIFTVSDWKSNRKSCLQSIDSKIGKGPWIVRSSSSEEDTATASHAG